MPRKTEDQEFLEYVVMCIVNNPDEVRVTRTSDDMGVLLSLRVNRADMGIVIGKQGMMAESIRILLHSVGIKINARVNLKIEEPDEYEPYGK